MAKIMIKYGLFSLLFFCLAGLPVLAEEEPVISITGVKVDTSLFAGEQISEALDDYVAPLIGGHVKLEFVELEHYEQVFSKYDVSNRMPDVFFLPSSQFLQTYQEHGKLLPLSDLLDTYGQGILDAVWEYVVPQLKGN